MNWYPENYQKRYELNRGKMIEIPKPKGKHSQIASDWAYHLGTAFRQANKPYSIPRECIVKIANNTGYEPDMIILDNKKATMANLWKF